MKIGTQLFLSIVCVAGIAIYQVSDFALQEIKPRYREAIEETLVDTANILAAELGAMSRGGTIDLSVVTAVGEELRRRTLRAQVYTLTKTSIDSRIQVTDRHGVVLFDSFRPENVGRDFSQWRNILLTLRGEYGARTSRDDEQDPTSTVLYVSAPVLAGGEIVGVVTVAKPTRSSNFFIQVLRRRFLRASVFTALALGLVAALIAQFVTQPIRRLTSYARDLSEGKDSPPPKLGSGEIAVLGDAFEEMRRALQGRSYIEEYVQHLTHELKSPIAAIRGAAELLENPEMPEANRTRFLANIGAESHRMQRIIERLLEIASVENLGQIAAEPTDLNLILDEVCEAALTKSAQRHVRLELSRTESVIVAGERFLLWQCFANVLDNALEFSPPESVVTLSIERDPLGRSAVVSITDRGPGIPDYARERIFERFFSLPRPDTGKKSSGLGLSFVRAVLRLHRGRIEITSGENGAGTEVRIVIPIGTQKGGGQKGETQKRAPN